MLMIDTSRRSVRDWKADQALGRFEPAGDCMDPIPVHAKGLPDRATVNLGIEKDKPAFIKFGIRCRKCEACLLHRQRLWTARAVDMIAASSRTWFGTLTVAPAHRVSMLYRADLQHTAATGEAWSALRQPDQFRKLVDQAAPAVTTFLKRVRKTAAFRYLLVSEEHKDGFPHFHMLLHEMGAAIPKRTLDDQWRLGFSQWRLVDRGNPQAAHYVCKYLSKSALTRVRASQRYGQSGTLAGLLAKTLAVLPERGKHVGGGIAVSWGGQNS